VPNKYNWTTHEEAILREHYPRGGLSACEPLLTGRSRLAIYQRANAQGLRAPGRVNVRQRWTPDPFTDEAIRELYLQPPTRGAVNALADRLGQPRWRISARARELGLVAPRLKDPNWSEDELEIVEESAHLALGAIAQRLRRRGFKRSQTAIKVKLGRLRVGLRDARAAAGMYSAYQLSQLMGVDNKSVTRWINLEMLKAERRNTERTGSQGGDPYLISAAQVRAFMARHPQSVDLRKVDRAWFIELTCGAVA
jgi:hypothetical protein